MAASPWKSLIRFKDAQGKIQYGEPLDSEFSRATVFSGPDVFSLNKTSDIADVKELLASCEPSAILCIGLNYRDHAIECNFPIPEYPILFLKTPNSLTSAHARIPIPPQSSQVDYENELCILTRRPIKDATLSSLQSNLSDYILAYTVGNDVSARDWQMGARSGGQFSYAKSYDGFCPVGPALVAAEQIREPQQLKMRTRVNGSTVQDGTTGDMIFGIAELLEFLSRGRTIERGTLVMTGTPNGVGMFRKRGPVWLGKGDVVECEIEQVGTLRNEFF
ncbi:putative fumarylacetoacetate hydrolase [Viridothelium virens]|uniref:Putative fumarylacetoacetate hydrolase n=1 Tax=Viridothelium virens TaxID=1048519 RepID=A0A6A6HIB7_VIRVR|nr:putative fumarylacetoacetate hydrolase [Viridothelium virens]